MTQNPCNIEALAYSLPRIEPHQCIDWESAAIVCGCPDCTSWLATLSPAEPADDPDGMREMREWEQAHKMGGRSGFPTN